MLIELIEDELWLDPEKVAVIKAVGKKQCAVFFDGQSAVDGGFTLDYPASEIAMHVNDSIEELDNDEEPPEESENEEEPEAEE